MPPANVLSPAINPMSPGNVMSLGNVMSSPMSQMTQSHAMQRHCPPVNTSTAYQNVINQQPIMNQPVITSQHQQHFYDNAVINATSLYNNSYSMHAPMVSHPPMGVPIMGPPHQPAPHNFTHVQSFNNYGQQPPFCHPNTRSTHPDQHSNPPHSIPLQSGPHTGYQDTIIPRPPSHSSSSASSRLRMSRLRHASFPSGQHVGSGPSGTEECGRPTPRINYTPDAQVNAIDISYRKFIIQQFFDQLCSQQNMISCLLKNNFKPFPPSPQLTACFRLHYAFAFWVDQSKLYVVKYACMFPRLNNELKLFYSLCATMH